MLNRTYPQGFSFMEVLVTVALVGLLVTAFLPAYRLYTAKTRVSEMLYFAQRAKTAIADYAMNRQHLPATTQEAGLTNLRAPMVAAIEVEHGTITVHASSAVTGTENSLQLVLTPTLHDTHISWACTSTGETQYAPATCPPAA